MNKLLLLLFYLLAFQVVAQNVISAGSVWKFYDQGNINSNDWKNSAFDDSPWTQGPAELGYGDGDEATIVSFGGNPNNKHITTYFRHTINLDTALPLACQIKLDDGAVVYVNGSEVFRANMPAGAISFNSLATSAIEDSWFSFTIPHSMLVAGSNTIAVEVHQANATSSDLSFNFAAQLLPLPPPPALYINELMASNSSTIADATGDFADWIELYNATGSPINLAGLFISDDPNNPTKYQLPAGLSVPANGYLILWASGSPSRGAAHLPFGLAAGGEFLGIYAPGDTAVIDSVSFATQRPNISWGRKPNGTPDWAYLVPATPNASNNTSTAYLGFLQPPTFSHSSGFYTEGFDLSITSNDPDALIYYTLDGSDPDPNNINGSTFTYKNRYEEIPGQSTGPFLSESFSSNLYSSPIPLVDKSPTPNKLSNKSSTNSYTPTYMPTSPIQKANVVRAALVKPGYLDSPIVTSTYLVSTSGFSRFNTLPTLFITLPEKDLFGYNKHEY